MSAVSEPEQQEEKEKEQEEEDRDYEGDWPRIEDDASRSQPGSDKTP